MRSLPRAGVACNKDDIIMREEAQAPVIAFDVNTGVYTAKVGREFTIAPTYEYVDRAVYAWKLEKTGRHLGRTRADLRHRRGGGRGEGGLLHRVGGDHAPGDDARTDARGGLPNPAARDRPLRRGGGRAGACLRDLAGRAVGREGDLPLDDASSGAARRRRSAQSDLRSSANRRWRIRTPPAGRER